MLKDGFQFDDREDFGSDPVAETYAESLAQELSPEQWERLELLSSKDNQNLSIDHIKFTSGTPHQLRYLVYYFTYFIDQERYFELVNTQRNINISPDPFDTNKSNYDFLKSDVECINAFNIFKISYKSVRDHEEDGGSPLTELSFCDEGGDPDSMFSITISFTPEMAQKLVTSCQSTRERVEEENRKFAESLNLKRSRNIMEIHKDLISLILIQAITGQEATESKEFRWSKVPVSLGYKEQLLFYIADNVLQVDSEPTEKNFGGRKNYFESKISKIPQDLRVAIDQELQVFENRDFTIAEFKSALEKIFLLLQDSD